MLAIFRHLAESERSEAVRRWPVFLVALLLIHSAILRWASYRWLNLDYPWYFQAGVAGQYLLGPVLQPSAFGVLLVVAVALFIHERPFLAALCVGLAAIFHSTYLLPGALLMLGFLAVLRLQGQPLGAVAVGGLALILVAPVVAYVLITFAPTSPADFREAQHILADFRIPHHCRPELWFDWIAGAQIGWVALAVLLVRRSNLSIVLVVPFALAVVLTLIQVATGSDTLALLFPWRISAVLVPIATAIILSRVIVLLPSWVEGKVVLAVAAVILVCLVAGGVWITVTHQGFQVNDNEQGVLDFVHTDKSAGDVYFIPVTVPDLAKSTHGSLSSDFKPLPSKLADDRIIPVDLQRFRLPTGAPIYVDFKSVPYADVDVLEWRRRIDRAQHIQTLLRQGDKKRALAELHLEGATHLVRHVNQPISGRGFEMIYGDRFYRVYRLHFAAFR
jgi:hypothetical protein